MRRLGPDFEIELIDVAREMADAARKETLTYLSFHPACGPKARTAATAGTP